MQSRVWRLFSLCVSHISGASKTQNLALETILSFVLTKIFEPEQFDFKHRHSENFFIYHEILHSFVALPFLLFLIGKFLRW